MKTSYQLIKLTYGSRKVNALYEYYYYNVKKEKGLVHNSLSPEPEQRRLVIGLLLTFQRENSTVFAGSRRSIQTFRRKGVSEYTEVVPWRYI